MVPKFTSLGFEVVNTPPSVHAKVQSFFFFWVLLACHHDCSQLAKAVNDAVEHFDDIPEEHKIGVIYGPIQPKFVQLGSIANEVHRELLPLHEEWAGGMKLKPTSAYGVRLYRNGSSLVMHTDKVEYYWLLFLNSCSVLIF